jgi:hypothetical protein
MVELESLGCLHPVEDIVAISRSQVIQLGYPFFMKQVPVPQIVIGELGY